MAFISEIHYANTVASSTGVTEFVEVTLSPAEFLNASDFVLATYQSDGTVRSSFNLGSEPFTIDPDTGYYVYVLATPVTAPDHTFAHNEAEAVALVDISPGGAGVISFLDIDGGSSDTDNILATSGPASGATSTTIPPISGGSQSIQFDIMGNRIDGPLDSGSSIVCFVKGTLIETELGDVPIEQLRVGDFIRTRDNGFQPVRIVHTRTLTTETLQSNPSLFPVRINAGALAQGLPRRDLWVSQQHRMLLNRPWFSVLFDEPEAMVRAKSLTYGTPIASIDTLLASVSYYHLVFDDHQIVFSEGAPSESFHPGKMALSSLTSEALAEFYDIFPRIRVGETHPEAPYATLTTPEWVVASMQ